MSSSTPNCVESELSEYVQGAQTWINDIDRLTIPASHTDVAKRFTRDCENLVKDCRSEKVVTSADLIDLTDYYNSLEIRYANLAENISIAS